MHPAAMNVNAVIGLVCDAGFCEANLRCRESDQRRKQKDRDETLNGAGILRVESTLRQLAKIAYSGEG
jgi:hypothetical protein